MEPYLALLLGPGIGQGFGEAGDRKIRSRRAIGWYQVCLLNNYRLAPAGSCERIY
jgi:hypothetical protein